MRIRTRIPSLLCSIRPIFALAALIALLTSACQTPAPQKAPPSPARFEAEIAVFEAADRAAPPPVGCTLFVGSSSFRKWTTLAQSFPERHVVNRGFGGSQMSDLLAFADRIILAYQPAEILVYEGDNDLAEGKSPATILREFRTLVQLVRRKLPRAKIYFVAVKPSPSRVHLLAPAAATNQLISRFCENSPQLAFIDVFTPMLDRDGQPRPELFTEDRLHLNAEGYALWTEIIRRALGSPPASP